MRRPVRWLLALALLAAVPFLGGPVDPRSYVSGNYILTMDGTNTGYLKSAAGGNIYAEVVNEAPGPDYFVRKHIGQPKYEDVALQVGFGMAKPVYDWISASWKQNYQRKNGSVVATDYTLQPVSERQFFNALLTEVTIPACDAASKEPAYLTLKLQPEYTRLIRGSAIKTPAAAPAPAQQKLWLPANFRLEIAGLATAKVTKIDSFTVKQTVVQQAVGEVRDAQREPGKLEFPNLVITLPESEVQSWEAWFEDFVVKGNNEQTKEKSGTLAFLSADRQTVLATIRFFNMGIVSIVPDEAEANADQIRRVQVELYVERMEFVYPTPAKAG